MRDAAQASALTNGGSTKELSSKWTLCKPPALVQVTESPWLTVTVLGLNEKPRAVTPWSAATAPGAIKSDSANAKTTNQNCARPLIPCLGVTLVGVWM